MPGTLQQDELVVLVDGVLFIIGAAPHFRISIGKIDIIENGKSY